MSQGKDAQVSINSYLFEIYFLVEPRSHLEGILSYQNGCRCTSHCCCLSFEGPGGMGVRGTEQVKFGEPSQEVLFFTFFLSFFLSSLFLYFITYLTTTIMITII